MIEGDALLTLMLLGALMALFATDALRVDVVALLAVLALMLTGLLTPAEAVAGFGQPVVALIAALFVLGAALLRTGVAQAVGDAIAARAGGSEVRLVALMMGAVALLSAFMSSTGAVAVFVPIALGVAARTGVPARRLLMPIAFGALFGGMLTLIGTPPNLIANSALRRAGAAQFAFFDFTLVGLPILALGLGFTALIGRRLIAPGERRAPRRRRSLAELLAAHGLEGRWFRARVAAGGPLAGLTLRESGLWSRRGATVLGVERGGDGAVVPARAVTRLEPGDAVIGVASAEPPAAFAAAEGLVPLAPREPEGGALPEIGRDLGVAEALVGPDSTLIGRTVAESGVRDRFGLFVIAVTRRGERLAAPFADLTLAAGDVLLLAGDWSRIAALEAERADLVPLRLPAEIEGVAPARRRAWVAVAATAVMLVLLGLQIVPSVAAVLIAALAVVLGGCLSMEDAYRAIDWRAVVLIGGMIPTATALETSGAARLIVDALLAAVGGAGPLAAMAALMALTSALSQVISNTATTVLLAPIALSSAEALGVAPQPMLMGVAIAASTAFATPVASPVNTLVLGPGDYRFGDFLRVGVPLQLLALGAGLLTIPSVFPFAPG